MSFNGRLGLRVITVQLLIILQTATAPARLSTKRHLNGSRSTNLAYLTRLLQMDIGLQMSLLRTIILGLWRYRPQLQLATMCSDTRSLLYTQRTHWTDVRTIRSASVSQLLAQGLPTHQASWQRPSIMKQTREFILISMRLLRIIRFRVRHSTPPLSVSRRRFRPLPLHLQVVFIQSHERAGGKGKGEGGGGNEAGHVFILCTFYNFIGHKN